MEEITPEELRMYTDFLASIMLTPDQYQEYLQKRETETVFEQVGWRMEE